MNLKRVQWENSKGVEKQTLLRRGGKSEDLLPLVQGVTGVWGRKGGGTMEVGWVVSKVTGDALKLNTITKVHTATENLTFGL